GDLARRLDLIQFAVVWFDGVEITADCYHTVPGSIGFKIVRLGISDRKSHLKRAQVSDYVEGAVWIDADHAVRQCRHLRNAMGAAATRGFCVLSPAIALGVPIEVRSASAQDALKHQIVFDEPLFVLFILFSSLFRTALGFLLGETMIALPVYKGISDTVLHE